MAKKAVKKTAKKKAAKKKADPKKKGEQIPLIDVMPIYAKKLIKAADKHKELVSIRMEALADEVAQKKVVLQCMHEKIEPDVNGDRVFTYDDVTIKVKVTEKKETVTITRKKVPVLTEE